MRKKRIIFYVLCIILIPIIYLLINLISYIKYDKSTLININSKFYPKYNRLVEITPDGTIYEHNFSEKPKKVFENSDIIYLESNLLIKKDGGIYFDRKNDYSGEKFAQINNAVSGSISLTHLAIVTSTGELYVTSINKLSDINSSTIGTPTDLNLVTGIPKVKKVVCGDECTFFLTVDGEVYGNYKNDKSNSYKKIEISNSIVDVDGWHKTFVALDKKGNTYEIGNNNFGYLGDCNYGAQEMKTNIVSISASSNPGFLLNKKGKISYWGCHNEGKAADVSYNGSVKGISGADKIYYSSRSLYVIKKNTIIKVNVGDLE